ncbi:hypothetical protein [Variovorax beijingensis]|uniref:DUF4124 domain-containing protein n=1 Tax=Variovorax beijingensis TaxID=2496117 RepID=A0ABY0ABB5_9BURK|nr:hypothetical protein [Variovorax beijingensis]RSZ41376.1 hypothetical protein EJO66_05475 [Variovorax beijingensis]
MAAALKSRAAAPRSSSGSERYWAPCLGVALLAVSLFYVTLNDLVHESAARAPALPPAVMPASVEAPRATARASEEPVAPPANATSEAPAIAPVAAPAEPPAKAAPAFVEVQKCVMPEGDAVYSDGPCPEGASASTLRLPRNLHAAARP